MHLRPYPLLVLTLALAAISMWLGDSASVSSPASENILPCLAVGPLHHRMPEPHGLRSAPTRPAKLAWAAGEFELFDLEEDDPYSVVPASIGLDLRPLVPPPPPPFPSSDKSGRASSLFLSLRRLRY